MQKAKPESFVSSDSPASKPDAIDGAGETEKVFIARQPIFDLSEKVIGYQLLFQQNPDFAENKPPETLNTSAQLIANTFNKFGLHQVFANRLAFIPISTDALVSDFLDLLPPEKIVLDIHPSDISATELIDIVGKLRNKHFQISLSNFSFSEELQPLYEMASYVAYDVHAFPMESIMAEINHTRHLPLQHIARNLQSYQDFLDHKGDLFALYQGHKFAPSETLSMNRMDPSTVRVMQLFNLVMSQADFNVIEEHFKHDVALCYSLLCYINSAGFGMPYKVESIRSTLMLLGYDFLWRWLSLLIFAGADIHAGQRVLINLTLIRGRLMELLGKHALLSQKDADRLFICGVFSLLDTLLGMPLEKALSNLNLPEEVSQALLKREGIYGPYLELTLAFETNNLQRADALCNELGIDLSTASADHMAAIEWARQLS